MKAVKITPGKLNGEVFIPSSKSICHRALISAGLSKGISNVDNITRSQDINATTNILKALGIEINYNGTCATVNGTGSIKLLNTELDCHESGSTLRFFIPVVLTSSNKATFIGRGKLVERPLDPYYEIFKNQNIEYSNDNGKLPLTINGSLKPGNYYLKGNVSSQFISGLLFALPMLNGDSHIILTSELESRPYVDLTIDVLKKFSIKVETISDDEYFIRGNQNFKNIDYTVEGDFSQAAFWLVAGALNGSIACKGININSIQGDRVIIDLLKAMGGKITLIDNEIFVEASETHAIDIDASQCPDLVPILAVLAALSKGTTKIFNAARVRLKECDRLEAITKELRKIGANIIELPEGLLIEGKEMLDGGVVNSWNDHRIVMALAVAALRCKNPVIINDSNAINKSYPDFFNDFVELGGECNEWNMG
jgi:3-phosphoshikimate 1-carboxyvinyltransferase